MQSASPLPRPPSIDAIARLTDLEELADRFQEQRGYAPELISHWDPKPAFSALIERHIANDGNHTGSLIEYVYSGYTEIAKHLRERLKEPTGRALLLTPSGTTSITNVIAYLKNTGCQHLHVIAPSYFAVEATAAAFGIKTSFSSVARRSGHYKLPSLMKASAVSAIWLTCPVYGTSCYINPVQVAHFVDSLDPRIAVIVDESLAFSDRPCLTRVRTLSRVIRISTPHKSICANGEKVSFVSVPKHLGHDFDAWSECFAGGIGAGGARALSLLESKRFDKAVRETRSLNAQNLGRMKSVLGKRTSAALDRDSDGHFVTAYWPKLKMSLGDDLSFMASIIFASGCVPMPSSRNRHPADYGFAFRVNLLRLDDAGLGALSRLADVLDRFV